MQLKFCVAIDTQIATKSPFRCNSTPPPIATEIVVLPKGFVAIGGKPCSVVDQDLDQSPEGPKANLASEGKPQIINPVF
jgi:hypothetical protein